MTQPVLFLVDDEPGVVHALRDDLSRRFGQDFCVAATTSARAGLTELADLAARQAPVALLIAGHAMTEMTGVDFLARAHELHPLAKRVLLVDRDYSARSPITQAMVLGQADYHITKPWLLEQDLYREVSQFLAEWAKDQEALFVLIGGEPRTQWLPAAVELDGGYILTGRDVTRPGRWPLDRPPLPLETSVPGVFAICDARSRSIKRVASAVGDGATAIRLVQEYLANGSAAA
jgi:CheY-like chemotaxis protein